MPAQTAAHRAAPALHTVLHSGAIPVSDAARQLGVTTHTLRMRIRRGTLAGEKRAGLWYVVLPATQEAAPDTAHDTAPRAAQTAQAVQSALVDELRSRVAFLERLTEQQTAALEREQLASAELRRLLAAEQQRRLPAPPVETVATQPERAEMPPASAEPTATVSTPLRPWWARWRR